MSTASDETRSVEFSGACFRCGEFGHWADSPECPWLAKAASKAEHLARIASFVERYWDRQITAWQKREFIKHENTLQGGGKVPAPQEREAKS